MTSKHKPQADSDAAAASDEVSADQSEYASNAVADAPGIGQSPQAPAAEEKSKEANGDWREHVKLGIEILGLAALIVYTVFSILQWAQIRWTNRLTREALTLNETTNGQTLTKMQEQIDAARDANKETHNLLSATQGAIFEVVVEYSQSMTVKSPYIGVHATNVGKTPARGFTGITYLLRKSSTGTVIQRSSQKFTDTSVRPGGSPFAMLPVVPARNPKDYALETFTVSTRLSYDDGFGNHQIQTACREMEVSEFTSIGWVECGYGEEWKKHIR
jgi:hypothetical protein